MIMFEAPELAADTIATWNTPTNTGLPRDPSSRTPSLGHARTFGLAAAAFLAGFAAFGLGAAFFSAMIVSRLLFNLDAI